MTLLDDQRTASARSMLRGGGPRVGSRARTALVLASATLMIAGAVFAFLHHRGEELDAARRAAASSAESRLSALLSYRHDHLDPDLSRAVAQTTGSFHDEYEELVTTTVRPTAERLKVDTTAEVSGVGVIDAVDERRVVVLAFVTQSTVTGGRAPVVSGSRVETTMVRVGDDWLISELRPV